MPKPGLVFIAACMLVIAGSVAVVASFGFGIDMSDALLIALALLAGMGFLQMMLFRDRKPAVVPGQIDELHKAVDDVSSRMGVLAERVGHAEIAAAERAKAAAAPLATEIEVLGTLVKQVADQLAAHEAAIIANAQSKPGRLGGPASRAGLDDARGEPARLGHAGTEADDEEAGAEAAAPLELGSKDLDTPPGETLRPLAGVKPAEPLIRAALPEGRDIASLAGRDLLETLRRALDDNRVELHLQPVVTLPQRRVVHYEALSRLRDEDGELIAPGDYLPAAERGGLLPAIDNLLLYRGARIVRRLLMRNREVGLFCNVAAKTLADDDFFPQFTSFLDSNPELARLLILELPQATVRGLGGLELETLMGLAEKGFRFSMDRVTDLKINPRELASKGIKFVKVPATLLVDPAAAEGCEIHPADLAGLLQRSGIALIAEKVESESQVVDLLDYEVRLGQGYLFGQPRPVRADVLLDTEAAAGAAQQRGPSRPAAAAREGAEILRAPGPRAVPFERPGEQPKDAPRRSPAGRNFVRQA